MNLLLSTIYIAGLLSFFAPCTYALMPAYIGILSDTSKNRLQTFLKTLFFVLGLGVTFITLGYGAGSLGALIQLDSFHWITGGIIILMGLHQMEVIRIRHLERYMTSKFRMFENHDYFTAFWIGLTFSFAWTPCVGPVLGAVLVAAAESSIPYYGAWLMLVYTLGLATPFVAITVLSHILIAKMSILDKYLIPMKKFGGLLIVIMGILLMTRQLTSLTVLIEKLF